MLPTATTYDYNIYFYGLICHMGDDKLYKHFAAMVRDKEHTPKIYDKQSETPIKDSNGVKFSFEYPPTTFSISDAVTSGEFRRFVPSLHELMGGHPRLNIQEFAIPVYYPASGDHQHSVLTITDFYPHQGYYLRGGQRVWGPDCVACMTQLTLTTTNNTVYIVNIKKDGSYDKLATLTAADNNYAIISNEAPLGHHHGHVAKYGSLLLEEDSNLTILKTGCPLYSDRSCRAILEVCQYAHRDDDLECSNNQWP